MSDAPLLKAIRQCTDHALLLLLSRMLRESRLEDVSILYRQAKRGNLRHAGYELTCAHYSEALTTTIIVKVIRHSVRKRHLDELASTVSRIGANQGLLISTSCATKEARSSEAYFLAHNVTMLTAKKLAALLTLKGIGLDESGEIDFVYFGKLEEASLRILAIQERLDNE